MPFTRTNAKRFEVGSEVWKWAAGAQADLGPAALINYKADIAVMWRAATPGTGTLTMLGSINPDADIDAGDGFVLHDTRGPGAGDLAALAMTSAWQGRQILEAPYLVWPSVNGGAGAAGVEVWLLIRGR